MPSPLPRPVRLAAALAALLVLPACGGGETSGAPAGTDWVVAPGTDTLGAAVLLGAFADGTVPAAFARLDAQPYRVEMTVVEHVPPAVGDDDQYTNPNADLTLAAGDIVGVFRRAVEVRPGTAPRVVASSRQGVLPAPVPGTLADTSGLDVARLLPRDPFPSFLPDDPPFLDLRTRGAYRVRASSQPGGLGSAEARVADPKADRPLVRNATSTRDPDGGLRLSVLRSSESAIYDERSSGVVTLQETREGLLPSTIETGIVTATPLTRRHFVTRWDITPLTQPDTTKTREP